MSLGEFDLIAKYFTRPVKRCTLGVGDDCALLAPAPGMQLAVSSDMLVEGRHFLSTALPQRLGHKALAVNLSDLAACGAKHVFKSWHFAAHPGGSVRLGDGVDSNLRTTTPGLYVCDASVMPEAMGLPPTLTLLCLGKRLGQHLAAG